MVKSCQAKTKDGKRCKKPWSVIRTVKGRNAYLCKQHAKKG